MQNVAMRRAAGSDAPAVASLVRRSFTAGDLALTIYGCSGIVEYLRTRFDSPASASLTQSLVAESGGVVVGFIELRTDASGVFLNYIATADRVRSQGVGKLLLGHALAEINAAPGTPLTLDVFSHNERARSWYSKLGFQRVGSRGFWQGQVDPARCADSRFTILDLRQGDACQATFGFSTLTLAEAGQRFTVGRIGRSWFRISDTRLLCRPDVLSGLVALEPERKLLVQMGEAEVHADLPLELKLLLRSDRLQATLPITL
jgi:ribosomal protein S18 acetylase RimI-like enzyme